MTREERRTRAATKVAHRLFLMREFGMQGGLLYARHRAKIQRSGGYMRTGNVSHFVSVPVTRKTRRRNRYAPTCTPPKRDIVKIDRANAGLEDIL